jgi:hypothetical protein
MSNDDGRDGFSRFQDCLQRLFRLGKIGTNVSDWSYCAHGVVGKYESRRSKDQPRTFLPIRLFSWRYESRLADAHACPSPSPLTPPPQQIPLRL